MKVHIHMTYYHIFINYNLSHDKLWYKIVHFYMCIILLYFDMSSVYSHTEIYTWVHTKVTWLNKIVKYDTIS